MAGFFALCFNSTYICYYLLGYWILNQEKLIWIICTFWYLLMFSLRLNIWPTLQMIYRYFMMNFLPLWQYEKHIYCHIYYTYMYILFIYISISLYLGMFIYVKIVMLLSIILDFPLSGAPMMLLKQIPRPYS